MATVKINAVDRSTGYTNSELEAISLRYTATDGEVGQGSVPVPNPAGTTEPYAGQSFQLLVGATLLFDGFIGPLQRERGETATGTRLVDTYTTGDENAVLSGFRAYRWVRPAETTKARFLAFLADFVPWVTDTTWVTNDVVENMTAKTYTTETLFSELFQEIKDLTGNTAFIENHRAHLHPQTVGITGGLAFSDTAYDYATTLPLYNPQRSKDPIDLRDDVMVVVPKHSYIATDPTAIARYDAGGLKHQSLVVLDSGTLAEATTKANALLASANAERITYEFDTGPLTAAQFASIPVGCLVSVTSAVLGLSASTQRIAAMTVSYRVGDTFMAHIEMGFPVRTRVAPIRIAPLPTYEDTFARIDKPRGLHGGPTPPPETLVEWQYDGDSPAGGWTSDPKRGLIDYDATGIDGSGRWTGLKMLGRGLVDVFARVSWELVWNGGTVTISIVKNGATVVATAFFVDSTTSLHAYVLTDTVSASDVSVAYGDILTVVAMWSVLPAAGGVPSADVATNIWFYADGSLTNDAAVVDGVADDLGTDQTDTTLVLSPDGAGGVVWRSLFGSVISPSQLVANTDNWSPTGLSTAGVIRVDLSADHNLTGIVAPASTQRILLVNISAHTLTLKHDATSTAANRFYLPGDVDMALSADTAVVLWYDPTSLRWRVAGGAGGGGASLEVDEVGVAVVSGATNLDARHGLDVTASGSTAQLAVDETELDGSLIPFSSLAPSILILPAATSPAETAEGSVVWDSDDDELTIGTGSGLVRLKTPRKHVINAIFDGGSAAITAGKKIRVRVPWASTVTRVTMLADQTTTTVADVRRTTQASYDGGATHPVSGDSLVGGGTAPTITASTKSDDATLTSWTVSLSAGDILEFYITSNTTAQLLTIALEVQP